jgi:hypothetical protein
MDHEFSIAQTDRNNIPSVVSVAGLVFQKTTIFNAAAATHLHVEVERLRLDAIVMVLLTKVTAQVDGELYHMRGKESDNHDAMPADRNKSNKNS